MIFFAALATFGTITIVLLALSWLVPAARHHPLARIGSVSLGSMIAQTVASIPAANGLSSGVLLTAEILAAPALAANWLFARGILEDDWRISSVDWLIASALLLLKAIWLLDAFGVMIPSRDIWYLATYTGGVAAFAHIVWLATSGFRDDFVAPRRRLRVGLVLALSLGGIITLVVETVGLDQATESLIRNVLTFAIVLAAVRAFAELDVSNLLGKPGSTIVKPTRSARASSKAMEDLLSAMDENRLFTRHGLSIAALGEHIGVPEHKLRVLINRELGYRNFSAFLNHYRIAFATQILSDPESKELPILTIAIDAGYTSLTTFNRAFKAATGTTPSQFRQMSLSLQVTKTVECES